LSKLSTIRFNRDLSSHLRNLADQFPAIIVTGARQTGKTTILKDVFPDHNYLSLDLPSLAEQAENDPEAFLQSNPPPLLIDEAQYAPKLFRHLKIEIDKNRQAYGQYILTGSQKFNLMKEVSDSLAGRCVWLELEGLSLNEIKQIKDDVNTIEQIYQYLVRGSLPELWARPALSVPDYYRSYLATYLERDVRQILNIGSLRDFERFIRVCAIRNGQLLNKTDVAKDVGIAVNTVTQWLSILEASNQIALLEPYFGNAGKRVVKTPKIYFCEIGMLCYLLGINEKNIQQSPFIGNIWEAFIYAEFRKLIKNTRLEAQIWFYRDNRAREVDFIVEHDNHLDFFEVKWTENPDKSATKVLNNVYGDMQQKNKNVLMQMGKKFVFSRTKNEIPLSNEVKAINLNYFLFE